MQQRIAVVTGGNKGIGLAICRQLARKGVLVILTSRNEANGMAVVEQMEKEELPARYHKLDVTRAADIIELGRFLRKEFGGRCDILVNNAGVFLDKRDPYDTAGKPLSFFETEVQMVRETMETNLYGPFLLCQEIVPMMKEHNYGRVVNMSSGLGQLSGMSGGYAGYRMSKTAINALTCLLAAEVKEYNIQVNSVNPGWVSTDMGGPGAPRTPDEGADTVVWLAMMSDDGPRGRFLKDRREIAW